jgi:alanine dehydrogenase
VTELGAVLNGEATGRESDEEITAFDSTGLAIQDLAIALAALEAYEAAPNSPAFDSVSFIQT